MSNLIFANYIEFFVIFDMFIVQGLVLVQIMMFGIVKSFVLLLCDQTSLGTYM